MQQLCEKYRKITEIEKDLTCHTFRHIWNTKLAEAGVSREGREILAGHSKGSATQDIYTHMGVGGI
ncbi:MAG: tyrosine-type recombinase/integrase [Bdellovibrionaceae bacterium]|nr:tyrosine-type recombinase/integrase [Pseudobdellovibrionaceae bacterium]